MNKVNFSLIFFISLTELIFGIVFFTYQWWLILFFLFVAVLLIVSIKFNWNWYPDAYLVFHITFTFIGLLNNLSAPSLLAGMACALITWELSDIPIFMDKNSITPLQIKFHESRFLFLITAVGTGLIISEILLFIQLKIPFIGMFILALLFLYAIVRIFLMVRDSSSSE